MTESMLYAGYGPNREPQMIESITGENASLVGTVAILNTGLWIQRMDQTPEVPVAAGLPAPRDILVPHWGPDGESYGVRAKADSAVLANLFKVSALGLELIRDWELVELGWKEQRKVSVRERSTGKLHEALTEFLPDDQPVSREANGLVYATYLNDPEKMHLLAKAARQEYLRNRG